VTEREDKKGKRGRIEEGEEGERRQQFLHCFQIWSFQRSEGENLFFFAIFPGILS
jgi:hypothetical protein